jgi:flagellar biosynthesis protein FliR
VLVLFALVSSRVAGLFIAAPLFSRRDAPIRFRVLLAFAIAGAMMPAAATGTPLPEGGAAVATGMVSELALGLAIGFLVRMMMTAFQLAGAVTSLQMGFSLAGSFDPEAGDVIPELASLQLSFVTVLFLLIDGHHLLVRSVAASFQIFPPGGALDAPMLAELLSDGFANMFELGARVAAPVSGLLLLVNGLIGFLNRVTPQLSIFNIGFPIAVGTGFLGLMVSLPSVAAFFFSAWSELEALLAGMLGP